MKIFVYAESRKLLFPSYAEVLAQLPDFYPFYHHLNSKLWMPRAGILPINLAGMFLSLIGEIIQTFGWGTSAFLPDPYLAHPPHPPLTPALWKR